MKSSHTNIRTRKVSIMPKFSGRIERSAIVESSESGFEGLARIVRMIGVMRDRKSSGEPL
jgi:hypothetical protein